MTKNKRVIRNLKKKPTKEEKFWIAMKEISSRQTRGLHCKANWKRNQHKNLTSKLLTVLIASCVSITFENGFG